MSELEQAEVARRAAVVAKMREDFSPNDIGKLPKPTQQQTDAVKQNYKEGQRCKLCHGWHHPDVQHLDYIGHAAITNRLLDADPEWNWEPLASSPDGLPLVDKDGGMWIRLTVGGVTRMGYGDAGKKTGPDAMKERIGDALRNAAMRFGAGLELWHKGEFLGAPDEENEELPAAMSYAEGIYKSMREATTIEEAKKIGRAAYKHLNAEEQARTQLIVTELESKK